MKTRFIAHTNTKFVINVGVRQIDLRDGQDNFIASICCKKCVKQLEKAIKEFKKLR